MSGFFEKIVSLAEKNDVLLRVSSWILALISKGEITESEKESYREISGILKDVSGHP